MTCIIAVAGKGGTGKTTFTGLLIDYLATKKKGSILAVDADANSNLNEVLGEEIEVTLGEIREEVNRKELVGTGFPGGMTRAQYLQYQLSTGIAEGNGYDMVVMGRTEGRGCYCYVNGMLREQLDRVEDQYHYVVIDNEAGMEHLSRGTTKKTDILFMVSDCSRRGIQAVGKINRLAEELELQIGQKYLIVNKVPGDVLPKGLMEEIEKQGLNLLGTIPDDALVAEYDALGKALVELPDESSSKSRIREICEKIGL